MSRVKPKRALVGKPDGLLISGIAWKTWNISEWASTRYREPLAAPAGMMKLLCKIAAVTRRAAHTAGRMNAEHEEF